MKYFVIILTLLFTTSTAIVAQETKRNKKTPAVTEPSVEIKKETTQREVQHMEQRLERLQSAPLPKDDQELNIRNAQIQELELQKMWKEKELALAEAEAANEPVAGLRGEADALKERYVAAKEIREQMEHQALARQAEKGDETAVPNEKIKLQREQLRAQFYQRQADLKREQQSDDPDAKRIAKLKGDIESLRRQMDELDERK